MVMEAMGALSFRCPVCRVGEGRRCRNRRGYHEPTHPARVRVWLTQEYAEERDRTQHKGADGTDHADGAVVRQ